MVYLHRNAICFIRCALYFVTISGHSLCFYFFSVQTRDSGQYHGIWCPHYSDLKIKWSLKSPASQLFPQPFVQAQIKENIKAGLCEGNSPVTFCWWTFLRLVDDKEYSTMKLYRRIRFIKDNIKAPRHWPLWGEFTGDRWIPRTKGQKRGKWFHLMTSSCPAFCRQLISNNSVD